MKKIAVIMDIKVDSGGALGMCLTKLNYIKKIYPYNIDIITTYKSTSDLLIRKYKIENHYFNKNLSLNRIKNLLYRLKLIKKSSLESYLNKFNVDKIFFISPSYLNILIKNIDYVYTVWDLSHLETKLTNLPEHDEQTIKARNRSYKEASKYAKFIILGTEENKNFFQSYYKCNVEKLITVKFLPYICSLKDENDTNINKLKVNFKNYILYPAQYWKHKNHKFLIDFFDEYSSYDEISDISMVCTGYDKGQLKELKKMIKIKNLNNRIKLLNFVSDGELKSLYNSSKAIIFPSLIGSHSFPLYEAFYFRKPVFYNQDILSKELKEFVYLIDVKSKKDLYHKMCSLLEDNQRKAKIIDKAEKKFYEIFNEKKIINKLDI